MNRSLFYLFAFFILSFTSLQTAFAETGKYLVILQAGTETHEGMARAVHALLYTEELMDHGHEAVLVFDGAGTQWINEWLNPESESPLKPRYEKLMAKGAVQIICDYCATAFKARKHLEARNAETTAEYEGHPSIAKWADQGYQLVVL